MLDADKWWHLLAHLLDACTESDADLTRAERAAVLLFGAIHRRLEHPTDP